MKQKSILGVLLLLCLCLAACGSQKVEQMDSQKKATLSITCQEAMQSEQLPDEMKEVLPKDGIIFSRQEVFVTEGETVLDVLQRELQEKRIALDISDGYVKGIGSLYEGACGTTSGWLFRVNGEVPSLGAGQCVVQEGDQIEWLYICDMNAFFGG